MLLRATPPQKGGPFTGWAEDRRNCALEDFEADGLSQQLLIELRDGLAYIGAMRTWSSPGGPVEGRVAGIDDRGRLLLDTTAGRVAYETGEFATNTGSS